MKRHILIVVLVALAAIVLSACNGRAETDFSSVTSSSSGESPARGIWAEETYISEYLNLRFITPIGWTISTDEDIAALLGMTPDILVAHGHVIPESIWEATGANLIDMLVTDPFTGINVKIMYERLSRPLSRITEEEYMEIALATLEQVGVSAAVIPGTTQIGDHIWYAFETTTSMGEDSIIGRNFVNLKGGYARTIIITYNLVFDPISEILSRFSSLNIPAPTPEPEHFDEALIGAWAWDMDNNYVYIFEPNGRGERGFYPDLEPFTWVVRGTGHLAITIGLFHETINYYVEGDVLNLINPLAGWSYTYVRWEEDFVLPEYYIVDFTGHPLVGAWLFAENNRWSYEFFEDGTGTRGWPLERDAFFWDAHGDHLMMEVDAVIESWTFTVNDDVLHLDNRQRAGYGYRYYRREE